MDSQRIRDHLVGAGVAVLLLLLVAAAFFWTVSEPNAVEAVGEPSEPTPAASPTPGVPPSDLGEGELWLDDLVLEAGLVATPESLLLDVHAVGHNVHTGPEGLVADAMTVDATVPFEVVAAELGEGITLTGSGSQATVERTITFAGRDFRVVATGTVDVEAGRLVVEPQTIDIGGPSFLKGVLGSLARELVTIEHDIEGLPDGLVLQTVVIEEDGFRAGLQGSDVTIVF